MEAGRVQSIAVIVVNYNTADLAIEAVQSVLDRTHGSRAVSVHLVDNASPDGDAERLREAHSVQGWGDRVQLYLETENHGFGRGNNLVLQALQREKLPPDAIFFLNPDAQVNSDTIECLAEFLESNTSIGICGCRIERPDGTTVTATFQFPTILGEFLSGLAISRIAQFFPSHVVALPADTETGPVDWVSGAAFIARFDVLCEIAFFDSDFFLYFEETEMMFRLRRRGYDIWHCHEASIVHIAGAATGMSGGQAKSGTRPSYWYESWALYHLKTRGVKSAHRAAFARRCGLRLNKFVSALRRRDTKKVDSELEAFSAKHIVNVIKRFSNEHPS